MWRAAADALRRDSVSLALPRYPIPVPMVLKVSGESTVHALKSFAVTAKPLWTWGAFPAVNTAACNGSVEAVGKCCEGGSSVVVQCLIPKSSA